MFLFYKQCLTRQPLVTNMVTTGLISGVGDAATQTWLGSGAAGPGSGPGGLNLERLGRAAFYSGFIFAPVAYPWFQVLSRVTVPSRVFSFLGVTSLGVRSWATTVARVVVDATFFPTLVSVPLYYTALALLEQKSLVEVQEKVRMNYWPTLLSSWTVWPAVQMVNFGVVPAQYRLLVLSFVSLGWNSYLSWRNAKGLEPELLHSEG